MSDINIKIQEHNASRKLQILKGFVEVNDIIEKGHMDFDSSAAPKGKSNLTKKNITDKNGHNTTKWVKQGEDVKDEKNTKQNDEEVSDSKTPEDHAKETSSEQLQKYLKENPDGEHAAQAKAELKLRNSEDSKPKPSDKDDKSNFDEEKSKQNLSNDISSAIEKEFGDIGDRTCHYEDLKSIVGEYDLMYMGDKLKANDINKVVKILEDEGWAIEKEGSSYEEDGDFDNETENGDDEDELLDILGDAVFNSQGKLNIDKVSETYNKLLDMGMTDKFIEKKIGESAWNHPDTQDDQMKTDWDDVMEQVKNKKDLHSKVDKVDKSIENLKKHLSPKDKK